MHARRTPALAFLLLVLSSSMAFAQQRVADPVARARDLYNQQKYDEAAQAAADARNVPTHADAAAVVFARARIERYRQTSSADDLTAAREALKSVNASKLTARDEVEFLVGLGLSMYLDTDYVFDDRYGAAAEQFELALAHGDLLDAPSRDLLFDWWALALDRQAQLGPEAERRPTYARIVDRAEAELARSHASASAAYWLAAGARGVDDIPRALGAASAAWIRAGTLGPRGAALRQDLDRLMLQVILPERARQLTAGADARPTLAYLQRQWEELKGKWTSDATN